MWYLIAGKSQRQFRLDGPGAARPASTLAIRLALSCMGTRAKEFIFCIENLDRDVVKMAGFPACDDTLPGALQSLLASLAFLTSPALLALAALLALTKGLERFIAG